MSGPAGLPEAAYAVALAALPGCGQHRLGALLAAGAPSQLWGAIREGRLIRLPAVAGALGPGGVGLARQWHATTVAADPAAGWARLVERGIGVWLRGVPGYPRVLDDDPEPPPVLFWQGDSLVAGGRPAAAIVGTRRCTSYGLDVARELGRDLSAAGVTVVSGLALGIDGAAHEGALVAGAAPPLAVVGSGLDVVYPARHRTLWRRVAEAGLLLSEAPLGAAPEPWRFPQRNRLIAGLAGVVVVVESHATGGSMSTVQAAIDRGIPVMAVPGSVRSPSSAGTNRLLADGVAPVTDAQDVLVALALEGAVTPRAGPPAEGTLVGEVDPDAVTVLAAVDWTPTATEDVLRRTGLGVGEAATALTRLEIAGHVRRRGGWWERVGQPAPPAPAN